MENKQKVVCSVCSGKGGFRKQKQDFLDSNWSDCLYCEGYGFVEENLKEEEAKTLLVYSNYRSKIMNEFTKFANVEAVYSDKIGSDLYIVLRPTEKDVWIRFIRTILKFSHYSDTVSITPKQIFFYAEEHIPPHQYYWEIELTIESMKDLDGFIELIKMFKEDVK